MYAAPLLLAMLLVVHSTAGFPAKSCRCRQVAKKKQAPCEVCTGDQHRLLRSTPSVRALQKTCEDIIDAFRKIVLRGRARCLMVSISVAFRTQALERTRFENREKFNVLRSLLPKIQQKKRSSPDQSDTVGLGSFLGIALRYNVLA